MNFLAFEPGRAIIGLVVSVVFLHLNKLRSPPLSGLT